ncbi:MAG: 4-hydroxy-tetrahydrodipicolinate reductase [Acutalibacteraceae bacterium]
MDRKIRILLSGCNGKMGNVISEIVADREDCEIIAGVDIYGENRFGYEVFRSFADVTGNVDVIIDFSNPSSLSDMLNYISKNKTPAVICTTGYSAAQVEKIKKASENTAIFYSGNMSIGINLLIELSKKAAAVLGSDFDIEIVEKHHNQKVDAPSGTALMIADGISSELENEPQYVYDRHSYRKKRNKNEIGIHSVRGGTIVGEHEVIFAGNNEVITLSHSAQSKSVFAAGSVNAAVFLSDKQPGMYDMSDLIKSSI